MKEPWSIISIWQEHEPTERKVTLPDSVIKSMISVCLAWQWYHFLAVILVSFSGLARISETMNLKRKHIVTHIDLLSSDPQIFFKITDPKTKRLMLRQHFKLDDVLIVRYVVWVIANLEHEDNLYKGSPAMMRLRWNRLCGFLGLPFEAGKGGVTPGCLRGSGATFWYRKLEDLPRLCWRGRWFRPSTLEHYLQEVAGQVLLTKLSKPDLAKLQELSELALPSLLSVLEKPSPMRA